jgi:hypothetical protein
MLLLRGRKTPHPDAQVNHPIGQAKMRMKMSIGLYAPWPYNVCYQTEMSDIRTNKGCCGEQVLRLACWRQARI